MIVSCHDLSEGGLAVAAAEMALAGLRGLYIDIGKVRHDISMPEDSLATLLLFSESASRFLVEVVPEQQHRFEEYMRSQGVRNFACIGEVTNSDRFVVQYETQKLVDLPVATLQSTWSGEEVKL